MKPIQTLMLFAKNVKRLVMLVQLNVKNIQTCNIAKNAQMLVANVK
jgi:hypothetical protein